MPLNDLAIRNAKPGDKDFKLADSGGLYLLITKSGSRLWRQKYRFNGAEKVLAHGKYPQVGLGVARSRRDQAKELLAAGKDPGAEKQSAKKAGDGTFEAWATAWHANQANGWEPGHSERVLARLKRDAIPAIGSKPLADVTRQDVLTMLRAVEERGAITIAKRLRGSIEHIYAFAIDSGATDRNPAAEIGKHTLKPSPRVQHMAKLPLAALPKFLRDLETFGSERTRLAIRLVILTWARTEEIRFATVDEFELDGAVSLWRLSKERMKMNREHLIPLSPAAVAVVKRLIEMAGGKGMLFAARKGEDGMSNTTMLQAVYSIGWKGVTTIHGMRRLASTWANDSLTSNGDRRYHPDWVEMALAHSDSDDVRGAYNAAEYLAPRKKMLCDWASVVDQAMTPAEEDDFDSLL